MNDKKKIAVFTGNRAEYGLQKPILRAIEQHPQLDYQLIVSGAHLDDNFGHTLEEIQNDGFEIHHKVKIEMDGVRALSGVLAIGQGVIEISKALEKAKPDILVVYADRFEGFAATIAGSQLNIPVAHIEGGDITEGGALDDSVRHAMTKLSHLHFTTNEQATRLILQMGEEPWRVRTVGFPAIDLIADGDFASAEEVKSHLDLNLDRPIVVFTQHSVTTEFQDASQQIEPSLSALIELAQKEKFQVIATFPNNDAGAKAIVNRIENLQSQKLENFRISKSLGRYLYHGILALAVDPKNRVICVGNSSSGIKETPAFYCPTVNIGSRQKSRLRGANVIDVGYDKEEIKSAIMKCAYDNKFRKTCARAPNPYFLGGAGLKIAEALAEAKLDLSLIQKKMTIAFQ